MKVILYVRDVHDAWVHVSTARSKIEVDELMRYATYKVSYGGDVMIEHKKDEV